jgi:diguanylate cyclase (GGDEF)-like protein
MAQQIWGFILSPMCVIVVLLISLITLLIFVSWLAFGFGERIKQFSTTDSDQTIWNVFQLETDYLQMLLAAEAYLENLDEAGTTAENAFENFGRRFDIFYSRVNVFHSTVRQQISNPDYIKRTEVLKEKLEMWTLQFDAMSNEHPADWKSLLLVMHKDTNLIRTLIVDGLQIITQRAEAQRVTELQQWQRYNKQLNLMMLLVLCATLTAIYLTWRLYNRTRNAETAVESLEKTSQELELLSVTDPLTGLLTRRALDKVAESYRKRRAMVIWLDIDEFKSVNDTWGHRVGDELLQAIAQALTNFARRDAHVFRLGGEEFGIIAPWYNEKHAQNWAVQICANIARTGVTINGQWVSRSASVGVAHTGSYKDMDRALELADQAMFEAKNKGKNQVCFAEEAL